MTRLKVAVRVRPLSKAEIEKNSLKITAVENGDTIAVTNMKVPEQNAGDSRERIRRFTFDYCFHEDSTQDDVYAAIGKVVGESIKRRHHSCVLAYGQSSSGKTHTMMGFPNDQGLTPRLCENIFSYLQESAVGDEVLNMKTSVSYLEIYNEKVRDLLQLKDKNEKSPKVSSLRIREHPKRGPYVQGLTEHQVEDSASLLHWLHFGNGNRSVAATLRNPQSSRSHAVFIVTCDGVKLHLVDLAGSERAGNRCYSVSRFREGANINKSLVALGNVISALAEQTFKSSKNFTRRFVPYRDSVLTWLLKDTLGGNSQTVMIATVSPSSSCYNETVNTLRFGQRAKLIVSRPVVNEDPKEKTIRELRAEIVRLKELLKLNQLNFPLVPSIYQMAQNGNHYLSSEGNSSADRETSSIRNDSLTSSLSELSLNSPPLPEIAEITEPLEEQKNIIINPSPTEDSQQYTKETGKTCATEKIIPLMEVSTKLTKDVPKLRRTFTELSMEKESPSRYGSHETLSTTNKVGKVIKPQNPSTLTLRRRSMDKSTPSLKTIMQKKPFEIPPKKVGTDKSISTEIKHSIKSEVESKVDSIRKQPIKPRSQIVAAVTQRLYSKSKKKEVGTNTEDTKSDLNICINARWRLKELTQRALRAHRSRHAEVQTDLFPVLRVKEISTDVDDLKLVLEEVKDVGTTVDKPVQKDVGTVCSYLDCFEEELPHDYKNAFVVTRSCGTQSSADFNDAPQEKAEQSPLSFSKYLRNQQDDQFEIANMYTKNPIYTSSVNINISHNYMNGTNDAVSEDSLDNNNSKGNVHLPTPDLISNHNSLEPHAHAAATQTVEEVQKEPIENKIKFATSCMTNDKFTICEHFCVREPPRSALANFTNVPSCTERVSLINVTDVCAPEICVITNNQVRCKPLPIFKPHTAKPNILEYRDFKGDDCIIIKEPIVLKSIMKQMPLNSNLKETESNEDTTSSDLEVPDSLEYHMINSKKVRFNKNKRQKNDNKFTRVMTNFMEEANTLIKNFKDATDKFEQQEITSNNFNLEVTLNDVDISSLEEEQTEIKKFGDNSSQTTSAFVLDSSTQYYDFDIPSNKYEILLEDSCKRLEEKINNIKSYERIKTPSYLNSRLSDSNVEDVLLQPNCSYNPWDLSASNFQEDSSLESNPVTLSDYGSLPRRSFKRYKTSSTCSPSAFLRQLTNMRKQVIESSREKLFSHPEMN